MKFDKYEGLKKQVARIKIKFKKQKKVPQTPAKIKRRRGFLTGIIVQICICFFVGLGTFLCEQSSIFGLVDVAATLKCNSEYREENKLELSFKFDGIDKIIEVFAPASAIPIDKQFLDNLPILPIEIETRDGGVVLKNEQIMVVKCVLDGKVNLPDGQSGYRFLEIKNASGVSVKILGFKNFAVKNKQQVKVGDNLGTTDGDLFVEVFYKGVKINLGLNDNGQIEWKN